ncbi:MAG: HPr(Ser) kinase/phosphatase [Deltaproteobacteria bacterium RBG_13_47_9]|nr:MAG: HPr(Ser) kinase/phosphatase [Deltaproteobacteria bacterium RBG_13_47_9]
MNSLLVQELEQDQKHHLGLTLMAGRKGLKKSITNPQVQKMGLALTGFAQFINPGRLQVIGNTEMAYFKTLDADRQEKVIHQICTLDLVCLVVTRTLEIPELLLQKADEKGIPLFRTTLRSFDLIDRANKFLEEKLAPTISIHGVLMDVFGVGVLILGKSGIGKSECALDLILRGHRLVADDMVYIQKRVPSSLIGSGFEVIEHHMEIRGLGIINIRSLFGVEAIRERKKIELALELLEWDKDQEYDRLGFEEEKYTVLDVELPMLRIPVTPARNLTTIIEVAARNHLLKVMGCDSALEFEKKLLHKMEEKERTRMEVEGEVE